MKRLFNWINEYLESDRLRTLEAEVFNIEGEYLYEVEKSHKYWCERNEARALARALAATIHEGPKQSIRSTVAARPILAKIRNEDWSAS